MNATLYLLWRKGMRSNNVLSAGSPSHFLRIMAFRMLSLGAFSSQSIMITLERSRFNEDKSWQSEIQNNYFIHSTVDFKLNPCGRRLSRVPQSCRTRKAKRSQTVRLRTVLFTYSWRRWSEVSFIWLWRPEKFPGLLRHMAGLFKARLS